MSNNNQSNNTEKVNKPIIKNGPNTTISMDSMPIALSKLKKPK